MTVTRHRLLAAILIAAAVCWARPLQAQYSATDLGGSPDAPSSAAIDINSRGEVVFVGGLGSGPAGVWTRDGLIEIGPLPGGSPGGTVALAINNRGQVVGHSQTVDLTQSSSSLESHAFVFEDGILEDLGTLPGHTLSYATAINNAGDIAGISGVFGSAPHAVLWDRGVISDLGAIPGTDGLVMDMNNRQQIVGYLSKGSTGTHAFLWQDGTFTELPPLPQGVAYSFAWGINASGQVAGAAATATGALHAVLWDRGAVIDLGTLPGGQLSFARGLNNRGQVVGYSQVANGETHAFLWENGTMIDLGTLLGGTFSVAEAISEAGIIVGESDDASNTANPTLWTRRGAR